MDYVKRFNSLEQEFGFDNVFTLEKFNKKHIIAKEKIL